MPEAALSPRDRLLETARRLFYTEGIHTVPVDRLVTEANVTRATFYRHFPAKEDLVEAYLRATDAELREAVAAALDKGSPQEAAAALLELIGEVACAAGFRGCHFINAVSTRPTSASSTSANTVSTTMPAITVSMSKLPSACRIR